MKVIISQQAGVCFGVKRALDLVEEKSKISDHIATLGPLIHNPQVVKKLEESGVKVVKNIAEFNEGTIVMPSHGVSQDIVDEAENNGLHVVDATCPFVANVHKKVKVLSQEGYTVVVVGDAGHSEVKAILSAAGEGALVISSLEDAKSNDWHNKRVGIVSQTTQAPERFGEVVGYIASYAKEVASYNTICYATYDRQNAARELAPSVDAMIVIGGYNSANTNRLVEICKESNLETYHIEVAEEIKDDWVKGKSVIGLTAGASTPSWIIEDVKNYLEKL